MRQLNAEENPYHELARGWFGSDHDANIEYYAKQAGWSEGTKAQYQQDLKYFIEWLHSKQQMIIADEEMLTEVGKWAECQGKGRFIYFTQEDIKSLKQLVEKK